MPHIRYTGPSDARDLDSRAWKQLEVEDQGKVSWDSSNNFTAEVSEKAAEAVLALPYFELADAPSKGDD